MIPCICLDVYLTQMKNFLSYIVLKFHIKIFFILKHEYKIKFLQEFLF